VITDTGLNGLVLVQTPLPVYLCPTDTGGELNDQRPFGIYQLGRSSYVASSLVMDANIDSTPVLENLVKYCPFYGDSSVRIRDITDGTSNVVLIGEREHPNGKSALWAGSRYCGGLQRDVMASAFFGMNNGQNLWVGTDPAYAFTSLHEGGAHFLMADGSVRFISENVDSAHGTLVAADVSDPNNWKTFQLINSINDDQVIGEY